MTSSVFFKPRKKFIDWLMKFANGALIVEVGAGSGLLSNAIFKAGHQNIEAFDINPQDDPVYPIMYRDAATINYPKGCVVLMARPCRGDWIHDTWVKALRTARAVVYVGVQKNLEYDIDQIPGSLVHVESMGNAGSEGEYVFVITPKFRATKLVTPRPQGHKFPARTVKVGICVDPFASMNSTQEEEIAEHKKDFREKLAPHKARFYVASHTGQSAKGIQPGTDLMIFDFGGAMPGASDLMESNARSLLRWCQDNPNSLALVVSSFTWRNAVNCEMEEMGLNLHNCLEYAALDYEVPKWFLAGETFESIREPVSQK